MASIKTEYGSSAALTVTLASLASSSTLVAGQESTAIDNTSNKYLDALISGRITTGTTPTANTTIEVWAYGSLADTPTYADVLDGTDSAETFTSVNVKLAALKLVATITVDSTSNQSYYFGPVSLAMLFGGALPKFWGVFVTHNTVAALHATGGNHNITYTPVYATVA